MFTRRPRRLPWPCSRIERDVLHSLWLEAQATGKPINAIVKTAVDEHLERRLNAAPAMVTSTAPGPTIAVSAA